MRGVKLQDIAILCDVNSSSRKESLHGEQARTRASRDKSVFEADVEILG